MSTIVDQHGAPIQREQLRQPQTAHMALLHGEYENHPSRGLTPAKLASILQRAERGDLMAQHELFQDMEEKDAHLFSEMQKRRLALQTLDWEIVPPRDATPEEEKLAAYVRDALGAMNDLEDVIFDMTDAIGHGYAPLELEWRSIEGQLLPVKATHRPQSWFCVSNQVGADRNELRLRSAKSGDGEALWSFGWLLHQHRARSGYVSRSGLFRVLAWPFLFKNFAVRDLAEFLEIYGLPLRLGTYHTSATEKDKATLMRAVVGIGHDAAAIIPEGMKLDFKEAAKGEESPFNSMISLMERSMSKAILGGTLTSGEGEHGTQALGNVHNEVRHDLKKADARQLGATLTAQLVYPILAVNRGLTDMRRCPRLVFDTQEPEDLKLYADAVPKLVKVGMRIPRSWAHEKLKIPEAQEKDAVLAESAAPSAEPAKPQAGQAANRAVQPTAEADELDVLAAEMLGEWEDSMADLVEPVEAALAASTTFEEFQAALEQQISGIDPARLVEMLARGNFSARIWGRLNTTRRQPAEK
jgi:phage gp29-like protein